uniref:Methyltransferase small domain-containing protein n=1 Tax=Chromera velia CCMP2878 TaxID=1169474 RepID=A0A0G4HI79_9ALVE|eukprot:Cvel_27734.t1-p1 / transcript=Cvel_27734.t1 / gene=Cvel_27734 / organism=Chromera_velia_CCMP2878 / gene_product=Protein-lysine methyltransferase C42C1.13, putative / transcript_product=Protein-lysine methyltransferase C42C1.13, putative / location=Cvel_scaffold3511:12017-15166(+) / protein_length=565 / sequence_SO=supercontig / SO=protein_coding / is_pseudo=false
MGSSEAGVLLSWSDGDGGGEKRLEIRAAPQAPLCDTGVTLWEAGLGLVSFFLHHPHLVRGKRVLELGAGVGLVSLFLSRLGAERVYATDVSETALGVCASNVERPGAGCSVLPRLLDWSALRRLMETGGERGKSGVCLRLSGGAGRETVEEEVVSREEATFGDEDEASNSYMFTKEEVEMLATVDVVVAADVVFDVDLNADLAGALSFFLHGNSSQIGKKEELLGREGEDQERPEKGHSRNSESSGDGPVLCFVAHQERRVLTAGCELAGETAGVDVFWSDFEDSHGDFSGRAVRGLNFHKVAEMVEGREGDSWNADCQSACLRLLPAAFEETKSEMSGGKGGHPNPLPIGVPLPRSWRLSWPSCSDLSLLQRRGDGGSEEGEPDQTGQQTQRMSKRPKTSQTEDSSEVCSSSGSVTVPVESLVLSASYYQSVTALSTTEDPSADPRSRVVTSGLFCSQPPVGARVWRGHQAEAAQDERTVEEEPQVCEGVCRRDSESPAPPPQGRSKAPSSGTQVVHTEARASNMQSKDLLGESSHVLESPVSREGGSERPIVSLNGVQIWKVF